MELRIRLDYSDLVSRSYGVAVETQQLQTEERLPNGSAPKESAVSFAHSERAFTLIELLVVLAIIAILVALLFPVFAQAKMASKRTVGISNARQVSMAVKMYLNDVDDQMPIFYAYNSQPPAGQPGHKGVEVEVMPYAKDKDVFKDPFDDGGPYLTTDVPGSASYWQGYGSSYRFIQCAYSLVAGESSQNNVPYTINRSVSDTDFQYPSGTRIMRSEMMSFFARSLDPGCAKYGYDCPPPYDYYRQWDPLGGTIIFADCHAKHVTSADQYDNEAVDTNGDLSGSINQSTGKTWYWSCD